MAIPIFNEDKGQVGVVHAGVDPPANKDLIWIKKNAQGKRLGYFEYNDDTGNWDRMGYVQVLDVLNSFSTTAAGSANMVRVLDGKITNLSDDLGTLENNLLASVQFKSQKNQANGYAGLNAFGVIPPELLGAFAFNPQGGWDASTGDPPTANPQNGYIYSVSTPGNTSLDGNENWLAGDFAYYGNGSWHLLPGFNPTSYNGLDQENAGFVLDARQGPVILGLITAANAAIDVHNNRIADLENALNTAEQAITDLTNQKQEKIIRIHAVLDANSRYILQQGDDHYAELLAAGLEDMEIFLSGDLMYGNLVTKVDTTLTFPPGSAGSPIYIKIFP